MRLRAIEGSWEKHPERKENNDRLSQRKEIKLTLRAGKHNGKTATNTDLINHFFDEVEELRAAIYTRTIPEILNEIADASNLLDMLHYSYDI